jgi:hypothetical protein
MERPNPFLDDIEPEVQNLPEEKEESGSSLTREALGFVPGVGTALDVADVARDVERGDYVGAGINTAAAVLGLIPIAGKIAGKGLKAASKAFRQADIDDAKKLMDDPDAKAAWQKEFKNPFKQKRVPEVQEAAEKLSEGKITSREYRDTVKAYQPIQPITDENFPNLPTLKEIAGSLDENKVAKGIVGVNKNIPDGTRVGSRLDIPAYENYNTWVVSLHDGTKLGGNVIGYGQTAILKNVEFMTAAKGGLRIAKGADKTTIGRIHGDYFNAVPEDVHELSKKLLNDPEWTQVGMNPFRHSFFYNKATGKPVFKADEVVQVGPLVLAKGVKTPSVSDLKTLKVKTPDKKIRMFKKGGDVMEQQMEMAFMNEGGVLKDDGMNKDPVSGNEVPSGSMAKEVRDDIPAQLSEGEYVVPADVVRFHGVQKFEELRNQAKKGFGSMEADGRIGGQPVDDDFPIPVGQLQTYDEGGVVDTYEEAFGQKYTPGQRYGSTTGPSGTGFELVNYTSPDGKRTIVIPHYNGKPMSAVPSGFSPEGGSGGGTGVSDPRAGERDRQEAENEAQQRRNMGQRVTVDPLMQAQIDKDRRLSQPKAIEDFTGKDYADYYNQTQGFGIDDIVRNVPLLGGLMSMQDNNIRKSALDGLKDGTLKVGSEQEFNAIKNLVTTAPQQGFLSRLFGTKKDFTIPTDLPKTYADYKATMQTKPNMLDLGGIDPMGQATSAKDLQYLNPSKELSTNEIDSVIKDLGKDALFSGSIADKMTKAMFGITDGNKINTPKGVQTATAGQLKGIIDNAQNIQQSVLDLTAGKKADGSPDTSKPIGSGPPSVGEIFDQLHGISQDYTSPAGGGVSSAPPDITNPGSIMANKGALVTKPKRKVASKKRTTKKGLGVKTKAT